MTEACVDDQSSMSYPCVCAIVRDGEGRILVIRRAHEPSAGRWSLPGGRVEAGETDEQAVIREVAEETGLHVGVGRLVGSIEIPAPGGGMFDVRDYACDVIGGELRAGDDAIEAAWARPEDLITWDTPPGFIETLTRWGVL